MATLFPTIVSAGPVGSVGATGVAGSRLVQVMPLTFDQPSGVSNATAPFIEPAVNQCVTVAVDRTDWMHCGQVIYAGGFGYFEVVSITSATNVILKNLTNEWIPVTEREEIHEVIGYDS